MVGPGTMVIRCSAQPFENAGIQTTACMLWASACSERLNNLTKLVFVDLTSANGFVKFGGYAAAFVVERRDLVDKGG